MKRNIVYFYTTIVVFLTLFTIKASAKTEISLLTCQPHAQIYSLYGHSAIRVKDDERGLDIAVNWGVFDTSQKNFSMNFIFGLTDYTMAIVPIEYFMREYEYYGSGIYQQRINLTDAEKERIMKALEENYRPENRVYRYNYVYDNCTTRPRDIIVNNIDGKVNYKESTYQKGKVSVRDLLHWKTNGYDWCKAGDDLLIGLRADKNATHSERQFLPEVLSEDFDSATITRANGQQVALVDSAFWLIQAGEPQFEPMPDVPVSLLTCNIIVLIIVIGWTLYEHRKGFKRVKGADATLFCICGILGIVLFIMIFSQHPYVQVNLQILVLNPLWLALMSPWTKWKYRWHAAFAMIGIFFLGNFVQVYADGMNILALALLIRILVRMKYQHLEVASKKEKKTT